MAKTFVKNSRRKFQEKLITILVNQFENVFTPPDDMVLIQDDEPTVDSRADAEVPIRDESFMYFIRTGEF